MPGNELMDHIPEHFRNDTLACNACEGSAQAQYQIARRYLNGLDGFPEAPQEFLFWLEKAATGGSAEAQSMLGSLMMMGQHMKQDAGRGMEWLSKAAEQGERGAMDCLYSIHKNGIPNLVEPDMAIAFGFLQRLVDVGHLESYNILAFHYFEGFMVPKDEARGFELWKYAADQGHPESQKNVSKCYEDGIGTKKNLQLAREYLHLAGNNGDPDAVSCIGYRLMDGTNGYTKDIEQAKQFLVKAIDASPECYAQYALCLMKSSSIQDRAEGLSMLEEKAREGDADSAFVLSSCYMQGEGVPKDFIKSLSFLQMAANHGHDQAQEYLGKLNMKKEPGSSQYKYVEPPKKPSLFARLRKKM